VRSSFSCSLSLAVRCRIFAPLYLDRFSPRALAGGGASGSQAGLACVLEGSAYPGRPYSAIRSSLFSRGIEQTCENFHDGDALAVWMSSR